MRPRRALPSAPPRSQSLPGLFSKHTPPRRAHGISRMNAATVPRQRWLRIIPPALIMYTISYVDRTNVSLAIEPKISTMMHDLAMNSKMAGEAVGIFFFGYLLLQFAGGHLASHWSARKVVSLCLIAWGLCAAGCGLTRNFRQF